MDKTVLEPVIQIGHILIAATTLGGLVLSAIGIYYGLKSTLQALTFELSTVKARLGSLEEEMKKQVDIRLVQHEHDIKLSGVEKLLDVHSKHLETLDNRQNNTQSAISELRLDRRWGKTMDKDTN